MQHHSKRMPCSCICHEAVLPLSVRLPISTCDRPYTIAMAFCTKDGRLTLSLGSMEEYNFQIAYRKGTLNGNADALSSQLTLFLHQLL